MTFKEYSEYGAVLSEKDHGSASFHRVLQHVGRGEVVLDLGAGTGAHTDKMRAEGVIVVPVDFHPTRMDIQLMDMHQLPLEWQDSFHHVVCHHVFEHSVAPIVVLRQMTRVLKPKGTAIIVVPNHEVDGWFGEPTHVGLISEKLMRLLCKRVGFEIVTVEKVEEDSVLWVLQKP